MKKSRIFLAATLALGIAGAFAAKAHTTSVNYKYFNTSSVCVTGTFNTDPCPSGSDIQCFASPQGTSVQLYTATGTCQDNQAIKRHS
jgi:hypothetical protein